MQDEQISDAALVRLMEQRAFALANTDRRDARLLARAANRLRALLRGQDGAEAEQQA